MISKIKQNATTFKKILSQKEMPFNNHKNIRALMLDKGVKQI